MRKITAILIGAGGRGADAYATYALVDMDGYCRDIESDEE